MASTAYKGLTIRIGADTTSLQSALKASNRTIASTQAMLRQVNKALKFDGSNAQAQAQQLKLVSARAKGLAERYSLLQRTMRQLGSSGALRKLAAETDDAAGHAQRCLERYNRVNDEIARFKHGFALKSQQGEMDRLNAEIREHESLLRQMRRDYAEMGSAAPRGMLAEIRGWDAELKGLRRQYRSLETAAKNAFSGVEGVDATLAKMREIGTVTDEVEREYRSLARSHAEAFADNRLAKELVQLEQCRADAAAARAEVRALAEQMALAARAGATRGISREFDEARESIAQCDAALKSMREDEAKLMSAFSQNRWMDGLQAEIRSNLGRQLDAAREKAESLRRQIKILDEMGLKGIESGGQGAERALERVTQESKEAHAALSELKGRAQAVADELSRAKEGTAAYRRLEERAAAVAKRMEQLTERTEALDALIRRLGQGATLNNLVAELYKTEGAIERSAEKMDEFTRKIRVSRQAMQQLGWSMYSTVTPAATMFAYRAVSAAEEVDAAYRNMRKTVEGTEEQFEALKQGAIDYSRTHYTSADTMLEIEAMGGQLGIAVDELESFSKVTSDLDIATNLNADQAAEQLGQVSAIMKDMKGDRGDAFPRFGDALTRLGNNAATQESNIMDVTSRIASMGTICGFSTPQILALATAVASTGQGSEAAGTAIAKTMSDIESAVGGGGDSLEAFAQVANMTAEDFKSAWDSDPSSALKAFIEGLEQLDATGGSSDSTLKSLKINSVRQKQALQGLSQTVKNLDNYIQMSEDAWNGVSDAWGKAGDAAREADAKTQGFSGAVQILRNNFDVFGAEVGESIEEPVRALADIVSGLTQAYSGWPDFVKGFADFGIAAAAAAGPALVFKNAAGGALKELVDDSVAKNGDAVAGALNAIGIAADKGSGSVRKLSAAMTVLKGVAKGMAVFAAVELLIELGSAARDVVADFNAASDAAASMDDAMESFGNIARENAEVATEGIAISAQEVAGEASSVAESIAKISEETTHNASSAKYWQDEILALQEIARQRALTAAEQARLTDAVQNYNSATGESIQVTDLASASLSVSSQQLRQLTRDFIDNAKAQGMRKSITELANSVGEAEMRLEELYAKRDELEKSGDISYAGLSDGRTDMFGFAGKDTQKYIDILNSIKADEALVSEGNEKLGSMERAYNKVGAAAEEAAGSVGDAAASSGEAADEMDEAAEAAQALTEALESALSDDANEWGSMLSRALEKSGVSTAEMAQAMDAAGLSVDDLKERFAGLEQPANTAFEKLKTDSAVSAREANENLKANKEAYDKFYSDLGSLEKKARTDQERAFVEYLKQSGVQNASLVEEYSKNLDLFREGAEGYDMEGVADPFNRALFRDEYGKLMEELQQYIDDIRAKAAEAVQQRQFTQEEVAAAFGGTAPLTAEDMLPGMDALPLYAGQKAAEAGAAVPVNFAAECNARAAEAQAAAQGLAEAPDKPLQGAADKAPEQGAAISGGVAEGMGSAQGEVKAQSDQIRQTTETAGAYKESAYGDGYAISSGIAAGIDAGVSLVTAAVNRLKAAANVSIPGPRVNLPGTTSGAPTTVTPKSRMAARAAATPAMALSAASVPAPTPVEAYAARAGVSQEAFAQARTYMATNGVSLQREIAQGIAAEAQRGARPATADEIAGAVVKALSGATFAVQGGQTTVHREDQRRTENHYYVGDDARDILKKIDRAKRMGRRK